MGYGGIDEVEIDEEYNRFYVKREGGYWNSYKISEERNFLDWLKQYKQKDDVLGTVGDIPFYKLS